MRDLLERLVREVQRSVQSVVGDPLDPVAPTEIVLVGGSARLPGLARFFEERTGLPARVLEVTRSGDGAEDFAEAGPALFAQAAALALRGAATERVTQTDFRQGDLAYSPDLSGPAAAAPADGRAVRAVPGGLGRQRRRARRGTPATGSTRCAARSPRS